MKHNPVAPSTDVTLDGHTYSLRWDFEAIAQAEELTDRPLLTGISQADWTKPRINLVRAMFFACARPNHPDITLEKASKLVTAKTLTEIWLAVIAAWSAGIAGPNEEATADPTTAQA